MNQFGAISLSHLVKSVYWIIYLRASNAEPRRWECLKILCLYATENFRTFDKETFIACCVSEVRSQNKTLLWYEQIINIIALFTVIEKQYNFEIISGQKREAGAKYSLAMNLFFSGYSYFPFYFHSFLLIDGRVRWTITPLPLFWS